MKRREWKIIFTAMAFVAVVSNKKKVSDDTLRENVLRLASLIDEFCQQHVVNASLAVADEGEAMLTDQLIERHVRELRETGSTEAPDDRQTLIKLHDRLQHRKARRMDREFYANVSDENLADAVLDYLNEELVDDGSARLA